jgi:hypothetical protein
MGDRVAVNGMLWGSVEPLVTPLEYEEFAETLRQALLRDKEDFRAMVRSARSGFVTRASFELRTPDLNNPKEVGWALVLPPESADTKAIAEALAPLVEHRRGRVVYVDDIRTWAEDYEQRDDADRPYYLLLAGSLDAVPFQYQYRLDVHAAVGRLQFAGPLDYAAYARKVVEFETTEALALARRAVVFATEHGPNDATFLSRQHMAEPLAAMLREAGTQVAAMMGEEATLANLEGALRSGASAPALVYTATHGLGVAGADEKARQELQGALVCQDYDGANGVFAAARVPEEPFLHGSVVFAFACYGAGTPQQSDYFHWLHDPRLLRCRPACDFVAALPTRLLAHPHGPLAFFGHLDPAWVYCFADPNRPATDKGWGTRMAPFRQAVSQLMQGATVGYAVKRFNEVYALTSVELTNIEDQFQRDRTHGADPQWTRDLVDIWMTRNDTQNFVALGDPAVRLKIRS